MTVTKTQTIEIQIPVFEGYVYDSYRKPKGGEHFCRSHDLGRGLGQVDFTFTNDSHFVYKPIPSFEGYEYSHYGEPKVGQYFKPTLKDDLMQRSTGSLWDVRGSDVFCYNQLPPTFEGFEFVRRSDTVNLDEVFLMDNGQLSESGGYTFTGGREVLIYKRVAPTFEGFEFVRYGKAQTGDYALFPWEEVPVVWRDAGESSDDYFIYKKTFTPDYSNPDVLLAATFNAIMDNPDQWDQGQWHCGSSHCFCGWSQVLVNNILPNDGWHIEFAEDQYQVSFNVAVAITRGNNNLDELYNWVEGLISGRIDRQTGKEAVAPGTVAVVKQVPSDDFRFNLEEIQNRSQS